MLALSGNFAYVFGAGMLATVNPCGFVMLPAYLTYFLGIEGARPGSQRASVRRALVVSACVSTGFFVVFLSIGLLTRAGFTWIQDEASAWLSIVIGLVLLVLGIATLFGVHLPFLRPRVEVGGRDRTLRSMFLFGISYALASIGCTLPTFTGAVLSQVKSQGYTSGVASIAVYGLGMGLVLSALTVSLALASTGLLRGLRQVMAHLDVISGVILVLAGTYLAWYGWTALDPINRESGIVNQAEEWQSGLATWVADHRTSLGIVLSVITVVAVIYVVAARRSEAAGRSDVT
jgi:cytochrome c-type biogenesis protein